MLMIFFVVEHYFGSFKTILFIFYLLKIIYLATTISCSNLSLFAIHILFSFRNNLYSKAVSVCPSSYKSQLFPIGFLFLSLHTWHQIGVAHTTHSIQQKATSIQSEKFGLLFSSKFKRQLPTNFRQTSRF